MQYTLDTLSDCILLQSNASNRYSSTFLTIESVELLKLLNAFQPSLHDITIIAYHNNDNDSNNNNNNNNNKIGIKLASCMDNINNIDLYTELIVPHNSLLDVKHNRNNNSTSNNNENRVSASLKDLKQMCSFCHAMHCDVGLGFSAPGSPLILTSMYRNINNNNMNIDNDNIIQEQVR